MGAGTTSTQLPAFLVLMVRSVFCLVPRLCDDHSRDGDGVFEYFPLFLLLQLGGLSLVRSHSKRENILLVCAGLAFGRKSQGPLFPSYGVRSTSYFMFRIY